MKKNIVNMVERQKFALGMLGMSLLVFDPSMDVCALIQQATGKSIPSWAAWTLITLSSAAAIVSWCAKFGIVVAPWLATALLVADSVSA